MLYSYILGKLKFIVSYELLMYVGIMLFVEMSQGPKPIAPYMTVTSNCDM